MSKKLLVAAAIAAAFVVAPALADASCGSPPLAPAIPPASDLAGKTADAARAEVIDAYHQVRAYQAALKPYRDCLIAATNTDKQAVADARANPDKDSQTKIANLQQEMNDLQKFYDSTVDTETQVVAQFNALHMEDCKTDTDSKVCPKH